MQNYLFHVLTSVTSKSLVRAKTVSPDVVTSLQAGPLRNYGSIPSRSKKCFSFY